MGDLSVSFLKSRSKDRYLVQGSFRPNAASAVSAAYNKGDGFSVVRTSEGLYTLTFDKKFAQLDSIVANVRCTDAYPTVAQGGAVVVASRTAQIRVFQSGSTAETLKGFIPLNLSQARLLASGVIPDIAAIGGCLASDTAPVMKPITTGREIGIEWAAAGVVPICFPGIALPPNFDATAAMRVHYMANCADLSVLTVGAFFGINGTDAVTGGTQAAVRSEERRVGKECYCSCIYRWSPYD
jgi:hypothetical protein